MISITETEREQIIERLVEDRFCDWVWARNYEGLEDALRLGIKGFENYTDKELKKADEECCRKISKGGGREAGGRGGLAPGAPFCENALWSVPPGQGGRVEAAFMSFSRRTLF